MAEEGWDFERYRAVLKVQARVLQFDPRLGRRLDSSDLVQETLLRACQHQEQFRGSTEGERVVWLRRILERVAHDRLDEEGAQKRDYRRELSLDDLLAGSSARLEAVLASGETTPADRLNRQEASDRLLRAISTLEPGQQDAILLRYFHELPVAEVARRLGKSERAVAGLLFRGLAALRSASRSLGGLLESKDA